MKRIDSAAPATADVRSWLRRAQAVERAVHEVVLNPGGDSSCLPGRQGRGDLLEGRASVIRPGGGRRPSRGEVRALWSDEDADGATDRAVTQACRRVSRGGPRAITTFIAKSPGLRRRSRSAGASRWPDRGRLPRTGRPRFGSPVTTTKHVTSSSVVCGALAVRSHPASAAARGASASEGDAARLHTSTNSRTIVMPTVLRIVIDTVTSGSAAKG